jgi:hypothetical protein
MRVVSCRTQEGGGPEGLADAGVEVVHLLDVIVIHGLAVAQHPVLLLEHLLPVVGRDVP